jgi:hypothetical protein
MRGGGRVASVAVRVREEQVGAVARHTVYWSVLSLLIALVLGLALASSVLASVSASSLESPAVREALSHELQQPGPAIVSQGGSGGAGDTSAPSGELVASRSTEFSDTWSAPHKSMVTRIFNEPVNYKGSDSQWHAIDNSRWAIGWF